MPKPGAPSASGGLAWPHHGPARSRQSALCRRHYQPGLAYPPRPHSLANRRSRTLGFAHVSDLHIHRPSWRRLVAGHFLFRLVLLLIYSIYALQPGAITFSGWGTELTYQNVPSQAFGLVFAVALLLLISLPPVIAAIGFFTLFFRVKERSSKYRALLVPIGIFMLFGLSYLVPLALYPLAFGSTKFHGGRLPSV